MSSEEGSTKGIAPGERQEQVGAEVKGGEHGSDGSRSEPFPWKPQSDAPGLQNAPPPYLPPLLKAPLPPTPDYSRPADGASRPYVSPSYTSESSSESTSESTSESYQKEYPQVSHYGHTKTSFSPYQYYPSDKNAPPPPPPLYIPDPFSDKTRTVEHFFAGFVFNIRTDAEVASKKLRVRSVDNHVEYYCSDVLLTKIKYKFERDIFSFCEDPDAEQLRDVKLCEKIEVLMGPIVAGLFDEPWGSDSVSTEWGVRECEGIGDGNFFQVSVFNETDARKMYDSQNPRSEPSSLVPLERSRPIVANMDAFHRMHSVEEKGDRSRSRSRASRASRPALRSIDRTQLLSVLRELELRTAIELAKQSHLTGSAVASIIGEKDYTLYDYQVCKTFSAEVPTLFGLFVSKIPRWASRVLGFTVSSSEYGSHYGGKYGNEEEPLENQVPNGKDSFNSPNPEDATSVGSDVHTLSATPPIVPSLSAGPVYGDSGSEDENDSCCDGQSAASGDDPFAHHAVNFSSEDDGEDGSDRQFQASEVGLAPQLHNCDDAVSIPVDNADTESVQNRMTAPIGDSNLESSKGPTHVMPYRYPLPTFPTTFSNSTQTIVPPGDNGGKKSEAASPETVSHAELQSFGSENLSSKDGETDSLGSSPQASTFPSVNLVGPFFNTVDQSPYIQVDPEKRNTNEQHGDRQRDQKEAASLDSEAEGHTNSQQENPPKNQGHDSHAYSTQEIPMKSLGEYQGENKAEEEGLDKETETSNTSGQETDSLVPHNPEDSATSEHGEQITSRTPEEKEVEREGSRAQESKNEAKKDTGTVSAYGSGDTRRDPVSILRQPRVANDNAEKTERKVMFTVPSSEQSESDRKVRETKLEEERHKDEFNEARRTHLRAAYPTNPLQDNSFAHSYLPQVPSFPSSPYSSTAALSIVEPYQEAVAAGQIYDIPPNTPEERLKHGRSSYRMSGGYNMGGSQHHYTPSTPPTSHGSESIDFDLLPAPATSPKHSRMLSRWNSYKPMHKSDVSGAGTSSTNYHYYIGKKRISLMIAKDTLSVTLGVVIVALSILTIALDPAEEENWFKRIEEGVFVMFSLGVPFLIAMRSRLTDNLEIMMPSLTRKVRSLRDLENMNKGLDRDDFVKQLQKALLFNESLSKLFSPKDACYKLSRVSGSLVVPERAKYKKVFKNVWFFGEELAYNKILGKAFRYRQKDNTLMIENESVDIEGVIVHVRRRRGTYTFGSTPEI